MVQEGGIVQILGKSVGMDDDVNRSAEFALRQPASPRSGKKSLSMAQPW